MCPRVFALLPWVLLEVNWSSQEHQICPSPHWWVSFSISFLIGEVRTTWCGSDLTSAPGELQRDQRVPSGCYWLFISWGNVSVCIACLCVCVCVCMVMYGVDKWRWILYNPCGETGSLHQQTIHQGKNHRRSCTTQYSNLNLICKYIYTKHNCVNPVKRNSMNYSIIWLWKKILNHLSKSF